jgi:hypothetical protein
MLNTFIDQEAQRNATTRVTAARDVVQALTDLLQAQNNFMLIFISYEVQRLQLDFALGTMQLDQEGLWIDPGRIGPDYGEHDPWAWRPGQQGAEALPAAPGKSVPGFPAVGDADIDQLPPPFLLPPANSEEPSPAVEPMLTPRQPIER